ncbi:phosphotransacetylase [Clostridium saccharoperbutylacetonicum]|uniref:Phosphate butyryltransferase Ptb n=3 Tax=Clostridium TaxID=1485 RepID=M1MWR5_9CLOT|nr:phosphate acyltransferase [Clostridium saccharoperbutylacetonicum]AGF55912.1 phosphate butyryltransferase Ptb [Clostridium saccharoperbutylacetonicum N1-4(HMT)]NRT63349.1 phosphotransacetylase [Clostridium saccharoperbutylacetonicum]NSB26711.1 phosphotransacetylase [Clostridium saccharoperbutylacetonicum]NSB46062.1 phosphotransacetylase [Clostridium saccharoperbutylacetonicum]
MQIESFQDLVKNAQSIEKKSRIAVVAAHDKHTLQSIVKAKKDNLIIPILIGNEMVIVKMLIELGEDSREYKIVHARNIDECLVIAVEMIHKHIADLLMKGKLETSTMMKVILKKENDLKKDRTMSVVGFFETEKYHKLLSVSDVAVNIYPDVERKKDILLNAVKILNLMGVENPKVALLTATENINPKMPETEHANDLKQMNKNGEIQGCIVEGPISFDLATSREATRIKGYESQVAGDADLLLMPDLVSANVLGKCLTGFAGAQTAGLLVGAKVPIILTSRSAEASDKYYSIALAAYVAQNY